MHSGTRAGKAELTAVCALCYVVLLFHKLNYHNHNSLSGYSDRDAPIANGGQPYSKACRISVNVEMQQKNIAGPPSPSLPSSRGKRRQANVKGFMSSELQSFSTSTCTSTSFSPTSINIHNIHNPQILVQCKSISPTWSLRIRIHPAFASGVMPLAYL